MKYSFVLIGAGRLGSALSKSLFKSGHKLELVCDTNLSKAKKLAKQVNSDSSNKIQPINHYHYDVIIICVNDKNIDDLVKSFIKENIFIKNKFVFHCAGSLTSDVLLPLKQRGAITFNLHPNFSFSSHSIDYSFSSVPFVFECDNKKALTFAKILVKSIGSKLYVIKKDKKEFYHAVSVLVTNFISSILTKVDETIFHDSKKTYEIYVPLIISTLSNFLVDVKKNKFSGPITRGDIETIQKNLNSLSDKNLKDIYKSVCKIVLEIAVKENLINKKKSNSLLKSISLS